MAPEPDPDAGKHYSIMNDASYDEAGNIAVKTHENREHTLTLVNGHSYVFRTRAQHITMAWIPPADVRMVLDTPFVCCGGAPRPGWYRLPSKLDVLRWTTNNASATF